MITGPSGQNWQCGRPQINSHEIGSSQYRVFKLMLVVWAVLVGMLFITGCQRNWVAPETSTQSSHEPQVIAVCYPLQYLTQRIAGDAVSVGCIVPAEKSALDFRPERADVLTLQQADLIIANGTGAAYANWLDKVSLPESKICRSATRGLALSDYIPVQDMSTVHSHGPEGEHSHALMVAQTWLDPAVAAKQAVYIESEMSRVFPAHADSFQANLKSLQSDLAELSESFAAWRSESRATSDPKTDAAVQPIVLTANPRLKFFTRALGLEDRHLNWFETPQIDQATDDLTALLDTGDRIVLTNSEQQKILLTTDPLGDVITNVLDQNGVGTLLIDPLDRQPKSGDYLSVMKGNLQRIQPAMEKL